MGGRFLGSKMSQRWRVMKVSELFATLKRCVLRSSPAITDDAGIVELIQAWIWFHSTNDNRHCLAARDMSTLQSLREAC